MKTLEDLFGRTEEQLIEDGWTINGLAIHKGDGSWADGKGAYADGEGAYAKNIRSTTI